MIIHLYLILSVSVILLSQFGSSYLAVKLSDILAVVANQLNYVGNFFDYCRVTDFAILL